MSIFAAEQLIIDRLQAQVPQFITVCNPSKIAGLKNLAGLLPACIVVPNKSVIDSEIENSQFVVEEQSWDLVIIVTHQRGEATTETLAGDLMQRCINSLSNFNAGTGFIRPFQYAGRPEPAYSEGYAEFTLQFKVKKLL